MRLQRGTPVAGVDPQVARDIARACHDRWTTAERIAAAASMTSQEVTPLLRLLEQGGFLESRVETYEPEPGQRWNTTLAGGALTMASFLKPISRPKAQALLDAILVRAAAYNEDDSKPYVIESIGVFGSYLRSDVESLGDLDLTVQLEPRRSTADSADELLDFARASGRRFDTFVDRLIYGQRDALRTLRARSAYINLHTEDVSVFTDQHETVYTYTRPSTD